MCWCIRLTCPIFINLSARLCTELADLICLIIMGQKTKIEENKDFTFVDNTHKTQEDTKRIKEVMDQQPSSHPGLTTKCVKEEVKKNQSGKNEYPDKPLDTLQKWNENIRNTVRWKKGTNMADRPLPVPVENEFYYMEVSRAEAEKLLEGHADGTFILRPSSKIEHVYTLSIVFEGEIYNIGCRKRLDNRLALGYSKPFELNFITIKDLIEYYYKEKIVLISNGERIGSTLLRKLNS